MASRSYPLALKAISVVLFILFCTLSSTQARDIRLPSEEFQQILQLLGNPSDILPQYVGSLLPEEEARWNGTCFYENTGYLNLTEPGKGGKYGGGVINVFTDKPHSYTCIDLYVFCTPYRLLWDWYFRGRHHTEAVKEWHDGELDLVKTRGVSVFLMPAGTLGTLHALWDVFPLFSESRFGEEANIAFLERRMNTQFVKRKKPFSPSINPDDVHSGDFIALSKIRGRWGAFETLEKWVTGAYAGHTAVAIRDNDGKLWIAEAGVPDATGAELIGLRTWEDWWAFQLTDAADPQVALLPLHHSLRGSFNRSAAWDAVNELVGRPYGYHNMIFSWIDTEEDNFPPPMDDNLVASTLTMWNRVQPAYASNMWNEALNLRLGTVGLDLPDIIAECDRRGMSFAQLLAIPEKDEWLYSDGKSVTCVVLILEMYKAAGLFGLLADKIEVTEFHVRDAYMLKFFEDDPNFLPPWCAGTDDPPLPYCQLLGQYRLELPGYNTIVPYAHMNERCPSLAPDYERPAGC